MKIESFILITSCTFSWLFYYLEQMKRAEHTSENRDNGVGIGLLDLSKLDSSWLGELHLSELQRHSSLDGIPIVDLISQLVVLFPLLSFFEQPRIAPSVKQIM